MCVPMQAAAAYLVDLLVKHDACLAARPPGPGPDPQAGLPTQAGAAATCPPPMPCPGGAPGPGYQGAPAAPGVWDPVAAALEGGAALGSPGQSVGYPEVHLAGGPGAAGYGPGFAAADQPPPPPPVAQGHPWLQWRRRRA